MGHRLTRIYTRTGDDGSTGLGDGRRLGKDEDRVALMGDVDELNCSLGLVLAEDIPDTVEACLLRVQHDLFDLGGELAIPGSTLLKRDRTAWLEETLDGFNLDLPPLRDFILPGGGRAAAACHLSRSVCRRAERALVRLSRGERVSDASRLYLNRLSDLLFVLARALVHAEGGKEVYWKAALRE